MQCKIFLHSFVRLWLHETKVQLFWKKQYKWIKKRANRIKSNSLHSHKTPFRIVRDTLGASLATKP